MTSVRLLRYSCQVTSRDRLAGVHEIAELLGVSRQRVDQLSRQVGFPEPVDTICTGRVWRLVDVEAWARRRARDAR